MLLKTFSSGIGKYDCIAEKVHMLWVVLVVPRTPTQTALIIQNCNLCLQQYLCSTLIQATRNAKANNMLWNRIMHQRLEGKGLRSVAVTHVDISQAHCTMLCLIMNKPKCLATAYYADRRECQLSLEPAVSRSYAAGSMIPKIYQNMGFGKLNLFR